MGQDRKAILEQRLERLRNNRTSGAMDLALEAIDLARDWIAAGLPPTELANKLAAMHPAIATVANVARLIRGDIGDLPVRLREVKESLVEGNRRIAGNLRPLIPATATVITLSNSSTVRDSLLALGVRSVYILESLPGGEGKQMAETLRKRMKKSRSVKGGPARADVRLVPDAAVGMIVPQVDCALVGIDTYDRAGAILHKIGTLPLALCCRHFNKPFYAAGHSFKFADRVFSGLPEPDKDLDAQLFDCTPSEFITRLVTERTE